jgi:hypothetical protein
VLLLGRKRREERWVGLEKERGRERDEVLFFLKKFFSNSFFKLLKLNSFSNFKFKLFSKHFNHFQNFQNILKLHTNK